MQTILGAGGDISKLLAKELKNYTDNIRLVARNPQKVNESDTLLKADLCNRAEVLKAVAGSAIVYLTVGLPYNIKIWKQQWPLIIQNVIEACLQHQTKLVFFDNVYLYAKSTIPHMTEESRIAPATKKGMVRAQLISMLQEAMRENGLQALIARSADFYGPSAKNGVLNICVINNFKKGKKAFWQSDASKIHSITFTPDAAKATALLGNTATAYGQVWHLPTSAEKLTGKDFVELAAKTMHIKPRFYIMSKWMLAVGGLFSSMIKELKEMQYQNDQDYFFDSSKFEKRFGMKATSYKEGIAETVRSVI